MIQRTTISLSTDETRQLKELAKKEYRTLNLQIIHMMEFYLQQKKDSFFL